MKSTLQKDWEQAEAQYLANPTPDNYRKLEEKAKAYELWYMLFDDSELKEEEE